MPIQVVQVKDQGRDACDRIRQLVFVEEQGVDRTEEWDGLDDECIHFLARDGDTPIGTARLRGIEGVAKVERVAVLAAARDRGVGRHLMEALEAEARRLGLQPLRLNAQETAIPFYERLGYTAIGPVFEEAGIPHRAMEKR